MSSYSRVADHVSRLTRQFGRRAMLGRTPYKVRGYISNIVDVTSVNEPELNVILERLLARPGHFIDIGANLGQTLGKVLSIDGDRAYLGFEPQIAACYFLDKFIRDNDLHKAKVLPFGLSSTNSIRQFWTHGEADVMGSLIQSNSHNTVSIILTRIGDEVITELGLTDIAAIKIDVEGAEMEVLRGLSKTLQSVRPPVIFELLPNFEGPLRTRLPAAITQHRNDQAHMLEHFLRELGYNVVQIAHDGTEHVVETFDLDGVESFRGTNYLALPKA